MGKFNIPIRFNLLIISLPIIKRGRDNEVAPPSCISSCRW